ncbi:MAG: flagellar assembly protein FliH, partial [Aeromonas veronii]
STSSRLATCIEQLNSSLEVPQDA